MKFISVLEIRIGDTVAWDTSHPTETIRYMIIESIDSAESETNFAGYDASLNPICAEDSFPCLIAYGRIFSCNGIMKENKYEFPINRTDLLLISRRFE